MGELLSRRRFISCALGAGVSLAFGPALALAAPQRDDSFPWVREEVLFGPNAGFKDVRAQQTSLGVYVNNGITPSVVDTSIKTLNFLAGLMNRRELFYVESRLEKARVVIKPGDEGGMGVMKASPSILLT